MCAAEYIKCCIHGKSRILIEKIKHKLSEAHAEHFALFSVAMSLMESDCEMAPMTVSWTN